MTNTDLNAEIPVEDDSEMNEIHEFDFERCMALMSVIEKISTVSPQNMAITGIAQAELKEMNEQAKDIGKRRGDRVREAEAKRAQAQQAAVDEQDAEETEDEVEVVKPRAVPHHQVAPPAAPGQPTPQRRV